MKNFVSLLGIFLIFSIFIQILQKKKIINIENDHLPIVADHESITNSNDLKIDLLVDGKEYFPDFIEEILNAKEEIFINIFIWRDDRIGQKIGEAILNVTRRHAKQGNKFKVLIKKDKFGEIYEKSEESRQSLLHKEQKRRFNDFKEMVSEMIKEFKVFCAIKMFNFVYKNYDPKTTSDKQIPHPFLSDLMELKKNEFISIEIDNNEFEMDHSKYIIIDNQVMYIGGINIEEKELSKDHKDRVYKDYMVKANSTKVVKYFKKIISNEFKNNEKSKIQFINNKRIKKEGKKYHNFLNEKGIIETIKRAKKSIIIEMAYWGNKAIEDAILHKMKNEEIDLTIFISKKSNLQDGLNKFCVSNFFRELKNVNKENRIEVFLVPNMLHTKSFSIDNELLFVGSGNFMSSIRSTMQEANVLIEMEGFPSVKEKYLANIQNLKKKSERVTYETHKEKLFHKSWKFFFEKLSYF